MSTDTLFLQRMLTQAKAAFTTRRMPPGCANKLLTDVVPQSGDLVLARVAEIGSHQRIERPDGRRQRLFPGDFVLVCYGHRYAPDQFEAEIPSDLGPCDLAAAGGIAARVLSRHTRMLEPTRIVPTGVLGDGHGIPLNVSRWALPRPEKRPERRVPAFLVVGAGMNSGKTTALASLVRGLYQGGLRVGAAKLTGTGSGGDVWFFGDAGAETVLDFTDAGFSSTYQAPVEALLDGAETLLDNLSAGGADVVLAEIADGLYQRETAALLASSRLASRFDGVIFACGDALAAHSGVEWLRGKGHCVLGMSGRMTASPLAVREAQEATGLRSFTIEELSDPATAVSLLALNGSAERLSLEQRHVELVA